jgi:hypothetical protein
VAHIIRNREKLKALVHYVVAKCEDPNILGSIKLNKVLWMSDLWAYVRWGQPITGEHYVKQQFGPVASTVGIMRELQAEGKIVVRERELPFGHEKTDYIALVRPQDVSATFNADEISLVDEAIDYVCRRHTAMQISDKTHDIIWKLAEIGEEIPYEAMWASRFDAVTKEDVAWAKKQTQVN